MALPPALGAVIFRLARRGTPLHRSLCREGRRGRWRTGGRDRQHGAWCARSAPRCASSGASAAHRRRDGRAPASLLYLEKLRLIHAVITALLTAGLVAWGIAAVAARPGHGRRHGADHLARLHHPALHARPRGGAGRPDPARRPAGGGDRRAAGAARPARPAGRASRCCPGRAGWRSSMSASPTRAARRCCGIST